MNYLDKTRTGRHIVELYKKYDDIGFVYPLSESQKRSLTKFKQRQMRLQQDVVIQSQANNEAIQFPVPEDEAFEWTDDLKEMAYQELIRKDIKYTMYLHRRKLVQKILTQILIPMDGRFRALQPQPLLNYFYSDHNLILKKVHEKVLVEAELLGYQLLIFRYIEETKMYDQITSMHSDES